MRANRRLLIRGAAALAIAALALGLRLTVSGRLPAAYDEPVYYNVGQAYAGALRAGDWARIPHLDENYEHPALYEIEGTHSIGWDGYMEFRADEESLEEITLSLFYDKVN